MILNECELWFDGGCVDNGTRNAKSYGSYHAKFGDTDLRENRFKLPNARTNNEAEYEALIRGLANVLGEIKAKGVSPAQIILEVRSDSKLVVEQINGRWRCHKDELYALCQKACELLNNFAVGSTVTWHGRQNNVERFGH